MNGAYRSGPIVWAVIIAVTCLLLVFFEQVLWLVVPALLALIIYYLLYPIQQRLVLMGVAHATAAIIVGASAFLLLVLMGAAVAPDLAANIASWNDTVACYLEGGYALIGRTLAALENRVDFLARARVASSACERPSGVRRGSGIPGS